MPVYVMADEFAMSSVDALDVCDRAGIPAESGATVLGAQDVERFRVAVGHGRTAPAPAGPAWALPAGPAVTAGPATPTTPVAHGAAGSPAWAVPSTGPAWASPQQAPASPIPPPAGTTPAGTAPMHPGPWSNPPAADNRPAGADIDPERWGRLQRSRSAASSAMLSGLGLIMLGVAITVGTFIVAPGGFFIVSFGPVLAGFSQIGKAQRYRSEVARVERALRRYA